MFRSAETTSTPRDLRRWAAGLLVSRVMPRMEYLACSSGLLDQREIMLPPWLPVEPKTVTSFFDDIVVDDGFGYMGRIEEWYLDGEG